MARDKSSKRIISPENHHRKVEETIMKHKMSSEKIEKALLNQKSNKIRTKEGAVKRWMLEGIKEVYKQ